MKYKRYIEIECRGGYSDIKEIVEFLNNYTDTKNNFSFEICNTYYATIKGIAIAKSKEDMLNFIKNITNKFSNNYRFDFNCTKKEILARRDH